MKRISAGTHVNDSGDHGDKGTGTTGQWGACVKKQHGETSPEIVDHSIGVFYMHFQYE